MTRAREKLVLCGSVEVERARREWLRGVESGRPKEGPLDPATVGAATSFADWLGPALARLGYVGESDSEAASSASAPPFVIHYHRAEEWKGRQLKRAEPDADAGPLHQMAAMAPVVAPPHDSQAVEQVMQRLNWRYPWPALTEIRGKISVTELKRRFEAGRESDEVVPHIFTASTIRRPAFLTAPEQKAAPLTATELGTATHAVLCHLDLAAFPVAGAQDAAPAAPGDEAVVREQIEQMTARGLLTATEAAAVNAAQIARFLTSPLGLELRHQPNRVRRELPFTLALRADEVERPSVGQVANLSAFSDSAAQPARAPHSAFRIPHSNGELVLVQGVIDCLVERPDGFVLIDYKTDQVAAEGVAARAESYRMQMILYARAVETIFRRPVIVRTLYFLHCGVAVEMQG